MQPLNSLGSEDEEGQVEMILERLKREVKQRRLLLYPYFRDYDRVCTGVCGCIRHFSISFKHDLCAFKWCTVQKMEEDTQSPQESLRLMSCNGMCRALLLNSTCQGLKFYIVQYRKQSLCGLKFSTGSNPSVAEATLGLLPVLYYEEFQTLTC